MFKILSALLIISLMTGATPTSKGDIYPDTMTVTGIDTEADVVTLTTSSGHMYQFYGVEDWQIGDICSCIMNDNGTETIEDDIIVDTKYSGHQKQE